MREKNKGFGGFMVHKAKVNQFWIQVEVEWMKVEQSDCREAAHNLLSFVCLTPEQGTSTFNT